MHARRSIKILGLSLLAAVSVMAVTAAGSQAANFRINGAALTANETVAGTGAEGELLVPGLGLKINCTSSAIAGTLELAGMAKAVVTFSTCTVLENKFCTVYPTALDREKQTNKGKLVADGLGQLQLDEKVHYLKVEGLTVGGVLQPFTTVYFGGAGCTLPQPNDIGGTTSFKLPTALTESVNQSLSVVETEAEEKLFGAVGLTYGKEPASIMGGAVTNLHLTGANVGKTFGAE